MRIWKYECPPVDWFELRMPVGARVVAFDRDPITGQPTLWAEVEEDRAYEARRFRMAGTGHVIEPGLRYIGTVVGYMRELVLHLYEPEVGP